MGEPTPSDDVRPWRVLSSEYLAKKPWYTVRVDRVELPNGIVIPEYWVSEYPPWVNVVAMTEDDQVVLVRQYRHGAGQVHFEIPAGVTDPDDLSLESAARRELLEETGFEGGSWSPLLTVSANPALQNNLTHTFLAEGVRKTRDPDLDASEDLRVHVVSLADVERLIETGGFLQALHVAPLLKLLLSRQRGR